MHLYVPDQVIPPLDKLSIDFRLIGKVFTQHLLQPALLGAQFHLVTHADTSPNRSNIFSNIHCNSLDSILVFGNTFMDGRPYMESLMQRFLVDFCNLCYEDRELSVIQCQIPF